MLEGNPLMSGYQGKATFDYFEFSRCGALYTGLINYSHFSVH